LLASFRHALQSTAQQISEIRFCIPCPYNSGSKETEEENECILRLLMKEMKEL
jgi:hypothetical protein